MLNKTKNEGWQILKVTNNIVGDNIEKSGEKNKQKEPST